MDDLWHDLMVIRALIELAKRRLADGNLAATRERIKDATTEVTRLDAAVQRVTRARHRRARPKADTVERDAGDGPECQSR